MFDNDIENAGCVLTAILVGILICCCVYAHGFEARERDGLENFKNAINWSYDDGKLDAMEAWGIKIVFVGNGVAHTSKHLEALSYLQYKINEDGYKDAIENQLLTDIYEIRKPRTYTHSGDGGGFLGF